MVLGHHAQFGSPIICECSRRFLARQASRGYRVKEGNCSVLEGGPIPPSMAWGLMGSTARPVALAAAADRAPRHSKRPLVVYGIEIRALRVSRGSGLGFLRGGSCAVARISATHIELCLDIPCELGVHLAEQPLLDPQVSRLPHPHRGGHRGCQLVPARLIDLAPPGRVEGQSWSSAYSRLVARVIQRSEVARPIS